MKPIESILKNLEGYLLSIKRDTNKGYYILEIGIPKNWIIKSNKFVTCELTFDDDKGKLYTVFPNEENENYQDVSIDDTIQFVNKMIEYNQNIMEQENLWKEKLEIKKKEMEKYIEEYINNIETLKDQSFDDINTINVNSSNSNLENELEEKFSK